MQGPISKVNSFIRSYVVMGADEALVTSAYVLHTWQFSESCQQPHTTPYLYITAPKGSGKTLLGQDVLGVLVRNPISSVGITGAGLFRIVEDLQPTLQIDEIDALYSGSKDEGLRMQLNAGYRRGATTPRVSGEEVKMFSPYCPKILMGIDNGQLPDTVQDRSIRIALKKATMDEMQTVQPFYSYEVSDDAAELVDEMLAWSVKHTVEIREYKPEVMTELSPRQWEIARSLLQIAHASGCEKAMRDALRRIFEATKTHADSVEVRMLRAIKEQFDARNVDRLTAADILAHLDSEGINVPGNSLKGLAVKLAQFDVRGGVIRIGNMTHRGYHRGAFADAWERYL